MKRLQVGLGLFLFLTGGMIFGDAFASLNRLAAGYSDLPPGAEGALRTKIASALEPIRLAPMAWFREVYGVVPGTGDRIRLLESVASTPIKVCRGKNCKGCSGLEGTGCVRSASAPGGGKGTLGVIHSCLYGDGTCPGGAKPDIDQWAERFINGVIYHRMEPARELTMSKANEKSSTWIRRTSSSVNRLLKACPGPYPKEGWDFLQSVGAATEPNSAIRKCGETYLSALKRIARSCKALSLSGGKEWKAFYEKHVKGSTRIIRCDAFCRRMMCRTESSRGLLTEFGGSSAFLVFDGACEGATPTDDALIKDLFPPKLRAIADGSKCFPGAQ